MNFIEYQNLDVWKECSILTEKIYRKTKAFPKEEEFGLKSQIRRSSVSIISNIAEGCGRNHTRDKLQFLYVSRGSLFEVETQLIISNRLEIIDDESTEQLLIQANKCKMLLNGFITYHKRKLK